MRKFYFENEAGERYPLNGERAVWLENPAGLGYAAVEKFADNKNGFFKPTNKTIAQGNVLGDLVFVKSAYQEYEKLINWMATADPLRLVYEPFAGTEYYAQVRVKSITKTELGIGKWLRCSLSLATVTAWYKNTPVVLEIADRSGIVAFQWDVTKYDGPAIYGGAADNSYSVTFTPEGHFDAALIIDWTGAANKPVFILTDTDGSEIGRCAIDYSLQATDELIISTDYNDSFVKLRRGGADIDLLPYVNLAYDPFFRAPADHEVTLRVTAASLSGSANVSVHSYYRSV